GWEAAPAQITFYKDVYPILSRLSSTQWVNEGFFMLFGTNSPSDFQDKDYLKVLSSPDVSHQAERVRVFSWFRYTNSKEYLPAKVPPHYGDLFGDYASLPAVDLSVTLTQYEILQRWAEGDFTAGTIAGEVDFEKLSLPEQTDALLKAPLAECLGGPFHPGIEITWPFRHLMMWEAPYRLKLLPENEAVRDDYGPILTGAIALGEGGPLDGSGPGSLTRWLGVPWQTDEASCLSGYDVTLYLPLPSFWSVRVPNTVLSSDSFDRASLPSLNDGQRLKHFAYRVDWLRDFSSSYVTRINKMVKSWHQLGVIARREVAPGSSYLPETWWVETERKGPAGDDPTLKQVQYAEKEETLLKSTGLGNELAVNTEVAGQLRESRPLQRHEL
ncbi:MAG TPA: LodA/GoxA family CTQ-dependent oxidase, partial [Mucilaginibacter sp.]|nr:LodA/GoxA family CTQ-dependent oxidase [Mucilaginibacter sp.]